MVSVMRKATALGNSSGVLLPREWLDKTVVVTLAEPSADEITNDVVRILLENKFLEDTLGIYMTGSHARKDKISIESDIDILILTNSINKEIKKGKYSIVLISESNLKKSLEENPMYYYPMIYESKTLVNNKLIESYKYIRKLNIKNYITSTKTALKKVKEIISMDKKLGRKKTGDSVAYSLILRLRSFYILKSISNKELWKKEGFLSLIRKITGEKEIYERYNEVKNKNSSKDNTVLIEDAEKIIKYLEKEIEIWERRNKGKKD